VLRNTISAILRAAEAGETFTIPMRGKAVARLVPPGELDLPRLDGDRETIRRILSLPVDDELACDLEAAEEPVGDP